MSGEERRRQERRRNQLQLIGRMVYFFTTEDVTASSGYVVRTLRAAGRGRVRAGFVATRRAVSRGPGFRDHLDNLARAEPAEMPVSRYAWAWVRR